MRDTETMREEAQALTRMQENLDRIDALVQRLTSAMSKRNPVHAALNAPDPEVFTKAAGAWWQEAMQNPARIFEHQATFWTKSVQHYLEAQQALASGRLTAPEDTTPDDPRFSNPLWKSHPWFNFIKQQYMLNAEAIRAAVADAEGLDETERKRLRYFSQQIIDMMAPTNFLATNPDALERAVATEGESLVKGLENLVADIEAADGELQIRLADTDAFHVGDNVGSAEGKVVYRNRMMEVIQYVPTTEKVHATPLIVFPPWINKFYVLDLKKENSFIRWAVDQGITLFVVSWVNPDRSYAATGLEQYVEEGYLTAVREVKAITGQKQVNAIGYCIGGTTLALTLALMKKRGDRSIKSATFFTALTDFSDQGDFTPFLQNDFVDGIAAEVEEQGILRSHIMARTFSFLRSNDLIYRPAIRSYMMGEAPPAFDLLYWNGDGTNLPGKMCVQYLRRLCQGNEFATQGFAMLDEVLHVSDVTLPVFAVTCETDHIAAWRASYSGVQKMGSRDKTFIVSQSGHIAGIVNPPSKKKYGHYTNEDLTLGQDDWLAGATFHDGSWWPRWYDWIAPRSGRMVNARTPGDATHPALCDAPGDYVRAPLPA
ncbi:PHA/PHB synthase family protein [Pseudooceanicola sp. C21-150M6]|uniref:PHA/PHB synthase family protein n=1 Tax=Pseudooceanicola sp. C21-150M6 TaxID=3434355 RepID=UPI003D7FF499